jgi:hypothetical protein
MSKKKSKRSYPPGWNAKRVKRVIAHYEQLSEDEQVAEDEHAIRTNRGHTIVSVPNDLLPAIRELLASRK